MNKLIIVAVTAMFSLSVMAEGSLKLNEDYREYCNQTLLERTSSDRQNHKDFFDHNKSVDGKAYIQIFTDVDSASYNFVKSYANATINYGAAVGACMMNDGNLKSYKEGYQSAEDYLKISVDEFNNLRIQFQLYIKNIYNPSQLKPRL